MLGLRESGGKERESVVWLRWIEVEESKREGFISLPGPLIWEKTEREEGLLSVGSINELTSLLSLPYSLPSPFVFAKHIV